MPHGAALLCRIRQRSSACPGELSAQCVSARSGSTRGPVCSVSYAIASLAFSPERRLRDVRKMKWSSPKSGSCVAACIAPQSLAATALPFQSAASATEVFVCGYVLLCSFDTTENLLGFLAREDPLLARCGSPACGLPTRTRAYMHSPDPQRRELAGGTRV